MSNMTLLKPEVLPLVASLYKADEKAPEVKVSIIIPVYNTAEYLPQCLDSAINQSLRDIEIIVVDDKSTDNSLQIIRHYEELDDRIKVIAFAENKGNGFGRNEAIRQATGTYIMFLDSDDWLESYAAEVAYVKAVHRQHKVVLFGYTHHFIHIKNRDICTQDYLPLMDDNNPNFFRYLMQQRKSLSCMPWQFLFLRSAIIDNNIQFSEGIYFEDVIFTIKAVYFAKDIGILKATLYHYRQRESSITNSASRKKISDMLISLGILKEFLVQEGVFQEYQREYLIRFLTHAVCWAFIDYFKLPKHEIDSELEGYMTNLRKSSLLRIENLLLFKDAIKEFDLNEHGSKNRYRFFYRTLVAIKYSYPLFRARSAISILLGKTLPAI